MKNIFLLIFISFLIGCSKQKVKIKYNYYEKNHFNYIDDSFVF
jgi:hypothetical protein